MSIRSNISSYSVASQIKLAEKNKEIESLKRLLAERSALDIPTPSTSWQADLSARASLTPSRKRHSSQQLENHAKEIRGSTVGPPSLPRASSTQVDPGSTASNVWLNKNQTNRPADPPVSEAGILISVDGTLDGIFNISNNGGLREEIEVGLESMNGMPFKGTITRQEAKFNIFHECLGLDCENFDGVRFGYRGAPVLIFKLIKAINVDELLHVQYFDFKQKSSRNGRTHIDIIKCKIRGLRAPQTGPPNQKKQAMSDDDGTRLVKIEGCEYRVPKEALIDFLSSYGVICSDIREEVFDDGSGHDGSNKGNNRTGTYSVKVRLNKDLPQLAPIMGKRIKLYYKGIQKLCSNCFGPHPRHVCGSRKVLWLDYVNKFISDNPTIPMRAFGKWPEILEKHTGQKLAITRSNETGLNSTNSTVTIGAHVNPECDEQEIRPPMNTIQQEAATADWLLSQSLIPIDDNTSVQRDNTNTLSKSDPTIPSQSSDNTEPTKRDFLIPLTSEEHKETIDKMILGGSLRNEAENIIAGRVAAYNKALKQYKKDKTKNSRTSYKKKIQEKQSTQAAQNTTHYGHKN